MNASLHCPLEPGRQARAELAGICVLAASAAVALTLSDLPWWIAFPLWLLASLLAVRELREPRALALQRLSDGSLELSLVGSEVNAAFIGSRRYGPWLLLDFRTSSGRSRSARVMPILLQAEQQRLLGRMLASARPAAAPSV